MLFSFMFISTILEMVGLGFIFSIVGSLSSSNTNSLLINKFGTFFELEKNLVEKLIAALNLSLSKSEERRVARVQTESFESFTSYSSALDALDRDDYEKSQKFLEEAIEIDDNFSIAWDKLDEIESILDEIDQTRGTGLTLELINKIEIWNPDKIKKFDKNISIEEFDDLANDISF